MVDTENWPDLTSLFDASGGPKYCWCMAWRPWPNDLERNSAGKKAALERVIGAGTPVGLLAYADGSPVGWC